MSRMIEINKRKIIRLHRKGYLYREIAEMLGGVPIGTLGVYISELSQAGILKWRQRGPHPPAIKVKKPKKRVDTYDWDNERVRTVVSMIRTGGTLKEIGEVLGITRERIRQVLEKIIERHRRKKVYGNVKLVYTTKEAAKKLKVSVGRIERACLKICSKKQVSDYYWKQPDEDIKTRKPYSISPEGMKFLRHYLKTDRQRTCVICGRKFTHPTKGKKRIVCPPSQSPQCSRERRHQTQNTPIDDQSAKHLSPWHRDLWEKLQQTNPPLPEQERWLTFSSALKEASPLTQMQLYYLGYRFIDTRPHTGSADGKPKGHSKIEYSASQLKIAAQVYLKYMAKG
ncbi:MAG: hypothetical protein CEN88_209 [Candidatus Berkelbacteria bacterium Licking1014_2]|uniref:RNA polymerase sigma-70 region 4 domain-containing protein n=1 Tax=Candidatus Berkelbacteria bacterium Licking1014_2 TaxID=2017146 RepID=A0A554LW01_9BACT|nr:MAG: hypothetical protein CEN88_209 [Candidatus Berkelbacteria bacterium Licking1014_2]